MSNVGSYCPVSAHLAVPCTLARLDSSPLTRQQEIAEIEQTNVASIYNTFICMCIPSVMVQVRNSKVFYKARLNHKFCILILARISRRCFTSGMIQKTHSGAFIKQSLLKNIVNMYSKKISKSFYQLQTRDKPTTVMYNF